MLLITKYNKEYYFSFFAINIYRKHAWVASLKGKEDITITNTFQKVFNESERKPNKIWEDNGSEF